MKASPTAPKGSRATVLRHQIETAEAEGVAREDLTLRLTHRDVHELKRDATLAVSDISFADGVMRYLGVKVAEGAVSESTLERPE